MLKVTILIKILFIKIVIWLRVEQTKISHGPLIMNNTEHSLDQHTVQKTTHHHQNTSSFTTQISLK